MQQLRQIPIHRAVVRPLLLAGGERELVLLNAIIIAALVLGVGFHWFSFSVAALLATVGQWGLCYLAEYDPQFRQIYLRHLRYKDCYSAQGRREMS